MHPATPAVRCDCEPLLIGGDLVATDLGIEVRNPARPSEIVGAVARGTPAHVDRAVAAAKAAQQRWGARTFAERARVIARALEALDIDVEARARLYVRENGKTLIEARRELLGVAPRQRLTLEHASALDAWRELPAPAGTTCVFSKPYGVVVSIVPWNAPVSLAFTQIVAALLAGNAVILKPPETCPLALVRTAALFAGHLEHGLLNVVTGLPSDIGDALTTHPDVAKIAFTGGIVAARRIMTNAAQTVKGTTFELGGNDAAIVLEDADLGPETLRSIRDATFQMAGQVCMAIKRIFVPAGRKQEFLAGFARVIDDIVVGDGLQEAVTMGPLHTEAGLRRATELLDDAVASGGHATALGRIHDQAVFASGYFMRPTLVSDVRDDVRLVAEEQFCPVIPVVTYSTVDEAVDRANDTVYGLSGSVWGRDRETLLAAARGLAVGHVWINAHGSHAINHRAPYGGMKQSGLGRKSGLEGVLEYVQSQTITSVRC